MHKYAIYRIKMHKYTVLEYGIVETQFHIFLYINKETVLSSQTIRFKNKNK